METNQGSVMEAVRKRISRWRRGAPFSTSEFLGVGSRVAVHQALSRLTRAGKIERLARGIFVKPKRSVVLGNLTVPAVKVVEAAVRSSHGRLQISGAEAANRLGLCTQVPGQAVYLTDGPSRVIRVGRQEIFLRHRSPKSLIGVGTQAGQVIEALRFLGKSHLTAEHIEHLRNCLPTNTKLDLRRFTMQAPGWMERFLRHIYDA